MSDKAQNNMALKFKHAMLNNGEMKIKGLSELIGVTPQNLANKFRRNNFTETDMREMAAALGYELRITLVGKTREDVI